LLLLLNIVYLEPRGEAAVNTNFIIFSLTRAGIEPQSTARQSSKLSSTLTKQSFHLMVIIERWYTKIRKLKANYYSKITGTY